MRGSARTANRSSASARSPTARISTRRCGPSSAPTRREPTTRLSRRCWRSSDRVTRGWMSGRAPAASRCRSHVPLIRRVVRSWRSTPRRRCWRRSRRSRRTTRSRTSARSNCAGRRTGQPSISARTWGSSRTSATTSSRSDRSSTRSKRRAGACAWRCSWSGCPRRPPTRSGHRSTARSASRCRPFPMRSSCSRRGDGIPPRRASRSSRAGSSRATNSRGSSDASCGSHPTAPRRDGSRQRWTTSPSRPMTGGRSRAAARATSAS